MMNTAPMEPKALRIPDAARVMGVGRSTIYALMSEGKLKGMKVGGRRLIAVSEIERVLREAA